jgi:hypothetical protein
MKRVSSAQNTAHGGPLEKGVCSKGAKQGKVGSHSATTCDIASHQSQARAMQRPNEERLSTARNGTSATQARRRRDVGGKQAPQTSAEPMLRRSDAPSPMRTSAATVSREAAANVSFSAP